MRVDRIDEAMLELGVDGSRLVAGLEAGVADHVGLRVAGRQQQVGEMVLAVGMRRVQDRHPGGHRERGELPEALDSAGGRILLDDPNPDLAFGVGELLKVARHRGVRADQQLGGKLGLGGDGGDQGADLARLLDVVDERHRGHLLPAVGRDVEPHRPRDLSEPVAIGVLADHRAHGSLDQAAPVGLIAQQPRQRLGRFLGRGHDRDEVAQRLGDAHALGADHGGLAGEQLEHPPREHRRRVGDRVDVEEELVILVGANHLVVGEAAPDVVLKALREPERLVLGAEPAVIDRQVHRASRIEQHLEAALAVDVPVPVIGACEHR